MCRHWYLVQGQICSLNLQYILDVKTTVRRWFCNSCVIKWMIFLNVRYLNLSKRWALSQMYMLMDLSRVRRHIECNADENESVRDRFTLLWHTLHKGPKSCYFHNFFNTESFFRRCINWTIGMWSNKSTIHWTHCTSILLSKLEILLVIFTLI